MVQLSSSPDDPTGGTVDDQADHLEAAKDRGRRRALDVILGDDTEPDPAPDGGLHPDTIRWLEANPDADTEAALRYDRNTRPYREAATSGALPPRGDPGSSENFLRSVEVNAARRAIRRFHDLEARTE